MSSEYCREMIGTYLGEVTDLLSRVGEFSDSMVQNSTALTNLSFRAYIRGFFDKVRELNRVQSGKENFMELRRAQMSNSKCIVVGELIVFTATVVNIVHPKIKTFIDRQYDANFGEGLALLKISDLFFRDGDEANPTRRISADGQAVAEYVIIEGRDLHFQLADVKNAWTVEHDELDVATFVFEM